MVAKRVSNVLQCVFADGVEQSLSGIRRASAIQEAQYEGQKKSVPEVVSAIRSESANCGVCYRRFHCIP